ncbi:hypothetical protein LTR17_014807 [Elasticomyces elasticus]|nr:hypothetical protein LTR17_014807 [Elasticomyces elasticus]
MAQPRPGTTVEEDGEVKSSIACRVCRKRKIKCGRELSSCVLCEQSGQQCAYPDEVRRPGPRIGSTQAPRKRAASRGGQSHSAEKAARLSVPADPVPPTTPPSPPPQPAEPLTTVPRISPEASLPTPPPSMQSLSFILHPSHDSCSPTQLLDPSYNQSTQLRETFVEASCLALGLQPCHVDDLIDTFFETFTSFQLFRQHEFRQMLSRLPTLAQTQALLASILTFAIQGCEDLVEDAPPNAISLPAGFPALSDSYLGNLAQRSIDEAIADCEDESLPLPLLQALVLLTHWLLIRGVRAKAWRYLGLCVRSGYELNLHLIDVNRLEDAPPANAALWCRDEERRRIWWAIWEMDVFASFVRRCPGGIDWSQNETFLPAEDERWQRGDPQRSCRMDFNSSDRWKVLSGVGNGSPKAWFLVMNSYAKEAQCITAPMGLNKKRPEPSKPSKDAINRLVTLLNAVHMASWAIPNALKYRSQHLHFGSKSADRNTAAHARLHHAAIYSIHSITQLARLMIYRYWIFHCGKVSPLSQLYVPPSRASPSDNHRSLGPLGSTENGVSHLEVSLALDQYLEASEEVYILVMRSYCDHHKYVNPYLANTVWLAGAVQLLYKRLVTSSTTDRDLMSSNFMMLNVTYNKFLEHWHMSKELQKTLEVVELELESLGSDQDPSGTAQEEVIALLGTHHDGSHGVGLLNAERLSTAIKPSWHTNLFDPFQAGNYGGLGNANLLEHQIPQPSGDAASSAAVRNTAISTAPESATFVGSSSTVQGSMGNGMNLPLGFGQPFNGDDVQDFLNSDGADPFSFTPVNADFTNYIDGMLSGSYMT